MLQKDTLEVENKYLGSNSNEENLNSLIQLFKDLNLEERENNYGEETLEDMILEAL